MIANHQRFEIFKSLLFFVVLKPVILSLFNLTVNNSTTLLQSWKQIWILVFLTWRILNYNIPVNLSSLESNNVMLYPNFCLKAKNPPYYSGSTLIQLACGVHPKLQIESFALLSNNRLPQLPDSTPPEIHKIQY